MQQHPTGSNTMRCQEISRLENGIQKLRDLIFEMLFLQVCFEESSSTLYRCEWLLLEGGALARRGPKGRAP